MYNHGCNFDCSWCSYKLRPPRPKGFIGTEEVIDILLDLRPKHLNFVGGEPTLLEDIDDIARMARERFDPFIKIGHSNGTGMPPVDADAASVSIKTLDDDIHLSHTGASNERVLGNFALMYDLGLDLDASSVLIPGLIGPEEIGAIATFIGGIDPRIPYHIIGYLPVPGAPWSRPTAREIRSAEEAASRHLSHVTTSHLKLDEALRLRDIDPRYRSEIIAGG